VTPVRARRAPRSESRTEPGETGPARSSIRSAPGAARLDEVYRGLLEAHGPQQWWPHADEDGRFEICLGAILTQNTAWRSAARALENLRAAGAWPAEAIVELPQDVVADLVRPSGHFNVQARKVQEFCRVLVEGYDGSLDAMLEGDAEEVRARLLEIWGIGPETADAMTLYAGRLPTFVVDAYTYRLFERLDLAPGERRYEVYRRFLLEVIGPDVERLNEWHALIVRHGQQVCRRTNPQCDACTLLDGCPFGQRALGVDG
jgi:endonuclease III related protein